MKRSHLDFCVPSSERHLPEVRRRLRKFCGEVPGLEFGPRELSDLELAVQEACVNAIRHARPATRAPVLEVTFTAAAGRLTIEVFDQGQGFDPDRVPEPDPGCLRDAGFGLFIIRRTVDQLATRKEEDGFRLCLTKFYPASAAWSGEPER